MKNFITKDPTSVARSRLSPRSFAPALLATSLCTALACERTAEGIKQDTLAISGKADTTADETKRNLESEVSAFKAETKAKLERLSAAMAGLEARAGNDLDASKQKLKVEIDETRAKLAEVKAESRADWEKAKSDLDHSIAELGKRMNATLDNVGDKVEKTLD